MSRPVNMPWTEQQREWLQALGHDVLMFAPGSAAVHANSTPSTQAIRANSKPDSIAGSPGLRDQATVSISRPVADSPLLRALARAAGRQPQEAEFLQVLPELTALRGNPAARRQLWPLLRALRKAGRR